MPDTTSVRQQILEKIVEAYQAVQAPDVSDPAYVPSPADWPYTFSDVDHGPLDMGDHKKRITIGVVAGPEKERFTYPYIECNFQVGIEFRITINKGDQKPALFAESVMTAVKRVIDIDRSWGGLAVDTKRIGNQVDLSSAIDKTVFGVLFIEVMFRHSHFDPRERNPDP